MKKIKEKEALKKSIEALKKASAEAMQRASTEDTQNPVKRRHMAKHVRVCRNTKRGWVSTCLASLTTYDRTARTFSG